MTLTVEVPASESDGPQIFEVPDFFDVIDDDIDEIEQSFAIVAEIGDDVPEYMRCFQTQVGDTDCSGRFGATEIRINDNDRTSIYTLYITHSESLCVGMAWTRHT